jgi:hypothetical protein
MNTHKKGVFGKEFTNEHENIPPKGVVPRFSNLEMVALLLIF